MHIISVMMNTTDLNTQSTNNVVQKDHILIVDDEEDRIIFLSTILETGGFSPVSAKTGSEALRTANKETVLCAILNVTMGGNEGVLTYIKLKSDPKLKKIPIIMISAIPNEIFAHFHQFRRTASGEELPEPEVFLESPPDAEQLIRWVQQLSQQKRKGTSCL